MNTYIINPMLFYWIGVVDVVKGIAAVATMISGVGIFIGFLTSLDFDEGWKAVKLFALTFVISGLIALFVPSQDTLLYMQIAKMATVENAELTIDAVKSAVEYIVTAAENINVG